MPINKHGRQDGCLYNSMEEQTLPCTFVQLRWLPFSSLIIDCSWQTMQKYYTIRILTACIFTFPVSFEELENPATCHNQYHTITVKCHEHLWCRQNGISMKSSKSHPSPSPLHSVSANPVRKNKHAQISGSLNKFWGRWRLSYCLTFPSERATLFRVTYCSIFGWTYTNNFIFLVLFKIVFEFHVIDC